MRVFVIIFFQIFSLILMLPVSKARIIGNGDKRVPLSELGEIGVDDRDALSSAIGMIKCGERVGVATVIYPGNRIITAAHIVLKEGKITRDSCIFFSFNKNIGKIELEFNSILTRFGHVGSALNVEPRYDWAVIHLKRSLPTGINIAEEFLEYDRENLFNIISFLEKNNRIKFDREPYAQKCYGIAIDEMQIKNGGVILATDCSSQPGQSGSPILVKRQWEWKILGILVGENSNKVDYLPFDSKKNSTKFLGLWNIDLNSDGLEVSYDKYAPIP